MNETAPKKTLLQMLRDGELSKFTEEEKKELILSHARNMGSRLAELARRHKESMEQSPRFFGGFVG